MIRRLLFILLCCSVFSSAQIAKVQPPANLGEPTKSFIFPAALGMSGFWSYWQGDRFVEFATFPGGPHSASVVLYKNDGQLDRDLVVWSPEASHMVLRDAVVARDGTVLVGGSFGTSEDKLKRFIAEPANDGTFRRFIWTDRFQPLAICPMKDGTMWVYGSKPWDPDEKSAPLLRHYSFEEGLLGEAFPKSSLPNPRLQGSLPRHNFFLVTDNDRLIGLDMDAESWFELNLATNKLTIVHVIPLPRTANLQGATLLTTGDAYATFLLPSDQGKPRGGVYQLIKHGDSASWELIKNTTFVKMSEDNFRGFLIGNDGDELVFRKATDHGTEVQWAKPEAPTLSLK